MKRLAFTISLILVVVLALSFLYVSRAGAKPPPPSVQMMSASYGSVGLGTTFKTVETLSFSVAAPAKLEVTSENETIGNPAFCVIALDGATFPFPTGAASFSPDVTVTDTSVAAGSHTLTVQCAASATPAEGRGSVSAIITTGL